MNGSRSGPWWFRRAIVPIVVAAGTVLAYANAAPNVAVHDDRFFVPSRIRLSTTSIARLFGESAWSSAGVEEVLYRPLLVVTLAADGAVWGDFVRGYHMTNITLHVTATLTLFGFVLALLGRARPELSRGHTALAAGAAALVFGVHPIHTEAVDSIFNRSEILVTACVLGSLWVLTRFEERRPLLVWALVATLYLAALLCRESAASLPALGALLLWSMHAGNGVRQHARRIWPAALLVVPFLVYLALRHAAVGAAVDTTAPLAVEPESLGSRLALVLATLREYLRMVVWPHPLRASYGDFTARGVAATVIVHLVALALAAFGARRAPALAFGIVFFYLALLPSTRLFTRQSVIVLAERVVYMPSAGLAVALAFGLAALGRRFGVGTSAALGLGLAALLVPLTLRRNADWRSERALFEAEVKAAPENGDAWRLLTAADLSLGRFADVVKSCDGPVQRVRASAQLHNNCGIAYDRMGRERDAEASYRRAIGLGLTAVGHANLARLYARLGRVREAEQEYQGAVDAETSPARRHLRRGHMILRFHPERREEARAEFEAALAIQPEFQAARQALQQMGER